MEKLWSFTKPLRPIKGIGKRPKTRPFFVSEYKDILYFTLVNELGEVTLIYQYDPKTGEGTDIYEIGGIMRNAPITPDGKLYFFRDKYYRCFDLNSKELVFEYSSLAYITGDTTSTPYIMGDDIYIGVVGAFICANKETAELKWRLDLDFPPNTGTGFFPFGEGFVVTSYDQKPYFVNLQGEILWQAEVATKGTLVYQGNLVMFHDENIYLVDGATGKLLTQYTAKEKMDDSLLVLEDGIVCGPYKFTIKGTEIKPAWEVEIKGDFIYSGLELYEGKIIYYDDEKNFYTVDAQSGEAKIEKLQLTSKMPEAMFVKNGKMYVFGINVQLDCFAL